MAAAVCAPRFLHLGFEKVTSALHEFVAHLLLESAEVRPVAVVEFLDELEGPATLGDVASDDLGAETLGDLVVPGLAEQLLGVAGEQIGATHQLMEGIEMAPRLLDGLESLGQFAGRFHSGVGDAFRAGVGGSRTLAIGHVPQCAREHTVRP